MRHYYASQRQQGQMGIYLVNRTEFSQVELPLLFTKYLSSFTVNFGVSSRSFQQPVSLLYLNCYCDISPGSHLCREMDYTPHSFMGWHLSQKRCKNVVF